MDIALKLAEVSPGHTMTEPLLSRDHAWLVKVKTNIFPPVLITISATFGWAVRGQAGFGAIPGCVFAGTLIAMAWFYLSTRKQDGGTRPYCSGWTILAIMLGIGINGMHGWSQYGSWVQGFFNYDSLTINPVYGYGWWFVASVPWGATGAVFLSWTRVDQKTSSRLWCLRFIFGGAGVLIAMALFFALPSWFLPYYGTVPYGDENACHDCVDTYNHNLASMIFMGFYLGFLAFEIWRKNWENAKLIAIVGLCTGIGWMAFQFWMFAGRWFPGVAFNWWRCWELSAGFSIGIGYSIAFMVCNKQSATVAANAKHEHPNAERFIGTFLAIVIGLVYAITGGIEGAYVIYDDPANSVLPQVIVDACIAIASMIVIVITWIQQVKRQKGAPVETNHDIFAWLYPAMLSAFFVIGLVITDFLSSPSERDFFIFYCVMWTIDIFICVMYMKTMHSVKQCGA